MPIIYEPDELYVNLPRAKPRNWLASAVCTYVIASSVIGTIATVWFFAHL